MRQLMVAALAFACLLPSLAMADESAHYQVQAVPYIQAALTAPMADLGEKTQSHLAPDALDLGLALLAGRQGGIRTDEAEDVAKLDALNARVGPLVEAYLKAHPGIVAGRVEWPTVVHETTDEDTFVDHYLKVHSADYWLEQAIYAMVGTPEFVPRHATDDPQKNAASVTYDTMHYDKAVDTHIVMAAAQCIVAARREAGLDYKAWSTLPLSIRLLQRLPRQDIQMKVDADVAAKGKNLNYPLGAAACGTDDQFKADVIALKSLRP